MTTTTTSWAGRTFGQLTEAEKREVTRRAAAQLEAELNANADQIAAALYYVLDHEDDDSEQSSFAATIPGEPSDLYPYGDEDDADDDYYDRAEDARLARIEGSIYPLDR